MALCNRFSFLRRCRQPFGVWHPICLFGFCDTFLPSAPKRSWNCCILHICFSFEANGFENPAPALEITGDTLGCCKADSGNHWSDRRNKGAGKTSVSASSGAAAWSRQPKCSCCSHPMSRLEQVKSSLQDSALRWLFQGSSHSGFQGPLQSWATWPVILYSALA